MSARLLDAIRVPDRDSQAGPRAVFEASPMWSAWVRSSRNWMIKLFNAVERQLR